MIADRRRLLKVAAGLVAVVLVAELGARVLGQHLPEPLEWHSYEAQRKVAQMDALRAAGGAKVVFVGTSEVNVGIDPAVLVARSGGRLTAYNAALSAGVPTLMDPWTLDVVLPRLHPGVVVLGVSSLDFSDFAIGFADKLFEDSPDGREATGKADAIDGVDRWLTWHSQLWARRFELRDPALLLDALLRRDPPVDAPAASLTALGRNTNGQTQRFDQRPRGTEPPVGTWALGTKNPPAITRLVDGVLATGAKVVLVDMPVTDDFVALHGHQAADYATYLAALDALAARKGVTVLHYDTIRDHPMFADLVHLNVDGAAAFSATLSDALLGGVLAGS